MRRAEAAAAASPSSSSRSCSSKAPVPVRLLTTWMAPTVTPPGHHRRGHHGAGDRVLGGVRGRLEPGVADRLHHHGGALLLRHVADEPGADRHLRADQPRGCRRRPPGGSGASRLRRSRATRLRRPGRSRTRSKTRGSSSSKSREALNSREIECRRRSRSTSLRSSSSGRAGRSGCRAWAQYAARGSEFGRGRAKEHAKRRPGLRTPALGAEESLLGGSFFRGAILSSSSSTESSPPRRPSRWRCGLGFCSGVNSMRIGSLELSMVPSGSCGGHWDGVKNCKQCRAVVVNLP